MSDTPRTDIMSTGNSDPRGDEYDDLLYFTRQLERELAAITGERDALLEDERLVLSASDNAHETLAEIRGLMPSAWECYSLPFCVVMLIQERDRLRECGRIVGGVSGDALKQLQDALAERDELQNEVARAQDNIVRHMSARSDLMAERDALLADKARLDKIQKLALEHPISKDDGFTYHKGWGYAPCVEHGATIISIRAAIDAAKGGSHG